MENFINNCPAGVYQEEIQILPEHTDAAGNVTPGGIGTNYAAYDRSTYG